MIDRDELVALVLALSRPHCSLSPDRCSESPLVAPRPQAKRILHRRLGADGVQRIVMRLSLSRSANRSVAGEGEGRHPGRVPPGCGPMRRDSSAGHLPQPERARERRRCDLGANASTDRQRYPRGPIPRNIGRPQISTGREKIQCYEVTVQVVKKS